MAIRGTFFRWNNRSQFSVQYVFHLIVRQNCSSSMQHNPPWLDDVKWLQSKIENRNCACCLIHHILNIEYQYLISWNILQTLTWNKQVNVQCAKASRLLGYVRRNTRLVKRITVRRSAYLTLVRSHLDYATQVWTPQTIDLIRKLEGVQRRATNYHPFVTKHMGTG